MLTNEDFSWVHDIKWQPIQGYDIEFEPTGEEVIIHVVLRHSLS
jgi:hypothetical protein